MKLSNPIVVIAAIVLISMSFTMVVFFPKVSEQQEQQQEDPNSISKLATSNISINMPTSKGYVDGNIAYFIATDASDSKLCHLLQMILDIQ